VKFCNKLRDELMRNFASTVCRYLRLTITTLLLLILSSNALAQQDQWQGIARIVAVGDIHGDYDQYIKVLRDAAIINRRGNWIADDTHLVQMGDLPDRGPDTDKIIAHMQKLEDQAETDGGKVHALIGNHEVMNVGGDLRYVHPGEYAALTGRNSRRLQDAYYQRVVEYMQQQNPELQLAPDHRQEWNTEFPLGFVEHRNYWGPEGEFGQWVSQHNAVVKINNILFVHGGISPQILGLNISEMNEKIRSELSDQSLSLEDRLSESEDGPLWYRGLASNDEASELPHVLQVLDFYDVEHIVIAHTPEPGAIIPRFNGRVLIVDVGISQYYGGYNASLLVQDQQLFSIHRGETIVVPTGDMPLLPYYQRIAEMEPDAAGLKAIIEKLQQQNPL